jgi:hypothetical protein
LSPELPFPLFRYLIVLDLAQHIKSFFRQPGLVPAFTTHHTSDQTTGAERHAMFTVVSFVQFQRKEVTIA